MKKEMGRRLEQIRNRLDLTQDEMGEKINKGKGSVSKYENGDASPPLSTLEIYAELGETTIDWIVSGRVRYQTPSVADICGENEKGEAWIGLAPTEQDIMNEIRNLPVEEVEDLKAYLRLKRRTGLKLTLSLAEHGHQTHPNKQSGG